MSTGSRYASEREARTTKSLTFVMQIQFDIRMNVHIWKAETELLSNRSVQLAHRIRDLPCVGVFAALVSPVEWRPCREFAEAEWIR